MLVTPVSRSSLGHVDVIRTHGLYHTNKKGLCPRTGERVAVKARVY